MSQIGILPRLAGVLAALLVVSCQAERAAAGVAVRSPRDVAVRTVDGDARVEDVSYGYDAAQGRAWVVLDVMDGTFNSDTGPMTSGPAPTLVPGLKYKAETTEIVLEQPGEQAVVCARVMPKRFLFIPYTTIAQTGNCGVTRVVDEPHAHDNGFEKSSSADRVIYFGRTR
jgi:hypothetical protein